MAISRGLVLCSGLPGTGKTTFARTLAALTRAEHVESDAVRRTLFAVPRYTPPESHRVFHEVERRARAVMLSGRPAIVDATNLTRRDRRRFVVLARELEVKLVAVRMVAPEEEVLARLAAPREGFSEATVDVYRLMRGRTQAFREPVVTVDSRYPLGPSLALVRALLEDRPE